MRWRNRKWLVSRLRERVQDRVAPGETCDGLSARDAETLASWVDAARERGPVLFVGAGWTRNAEPVLRPYDTQVHDKPLPLLWSELVEQIRGELRHDVGADGDADPLWLAELHRQRFGEDALMRLLRNAVPDERLRPGALHHALRTVRWRAILTTNYDTLLERTFDPIQRVSTCIDDIDLVRSAARDAIELLHLHGVIQRPETIVLALEDYRRYPQKHPGMLAKVRQLFLQHPVLFVGFGLTDPNFMQWSGWLADVVGKGKNPWVNLTFDPPPSLSYGRYWGTRLDFISVQPFSRFRNVVPEVLRVLGEALDVEERSEEVAWLRVCVATSAKEAIREVRELLDIGNRAGAEDEDWDRFRLELFDAAASHVLDLAGMPWREPEADAKDQASRGVTLEIDLRPPMRRDQDEAMLASLCSAFGPDAWPDWRKLLLPLFVDRVWVFHRVDLSRKRLSDVWNRTVVPLDDSVAGPPPGSAPVAPTGDLTLDALRAGEDITAPRAPRTAQELRIAGYLASQHGQWRRAAGYYADAASASRAEFEPLRTEWLTIRSRVTCLDASLFREREADVECWRSLLFVIRDVVHPVVWGWGC